MNAILLIVPLTAALLAVGVRAAVYRPAYTRRQL